MKIKQKQVQKQQQQQPKPQPVAPKSRISLKSVSSFAFTALGSSAILYSAYQIGSKIYKDYKATHPTEEQPEPQQQQEPEQQTEQVEQQPAPKQDAKPEMIKSTNGQVRIASFNIKEELEEPKDDE
ncbi:Hypothetical_protein [Hexamita inflata]|uniref:Hypothetical_protein n=1 Tax=Hexamita inflata TaxID=28002 RepID=A0AA86NWN4_9EUKA|nr:Hypothetical protein HINF_LOCUS14983 [Hexamita inflata]